MKRQKKDRKGLEKKYQKLKKLLGHYASGVIAFSGGLDSALLSTIAYEILEKKVMAVTAVSATYPQGELREAKRIAREIGISHMSIHTREWTDKNFLANTKDRCYFCKRELFSQLSNIANKRRLAYVFDGTNYDDRLDHRPGMRAKEEWGVVSPLYEVRLRRDEIRHLAKELGLSFWNKPSGTCLSSRIPYGEPITSSRIKRIEETESMLRAVLGEVLFRARDHSQILRIEIDKKEWRKLRKYDINQIVKRAKKIGYRYVTLDLEGYVPAGKR